MPRLIDADELEKDYRNQFESVYKHIRDSVNPSDFFVERHAAYNKELMRMEMEAFCKYLQSRPTIDAEPVRHGRWEWHEEWDPPTRLDPPELYDTYWICSACGTDLLQYLKSHFPDIPSYTECSEEVPPTLERCPSCGAKMDGGKDNDCA